MQRITEPELMDEPEQAMAYAMADFEAPHARVVDLFRKTFPEWPGDGVVLDIGCGPGDISVRFARAYPKCLIDGIDGAAAMLEAGHSVFVNDPDFHQRVHLHRVNLPFDRPPREAYDAVISNSLLHHLHDPGVLWNAVRDFTKMGAPVFVIDLKRPPDRETAAELAGKYVSGEPEVLQRDFFNSLLAAFTVDEVIRQIAEAGLGHLSVSAISDRHLMIQGAR